MNDFQIEIDSFKGPLEKLLELIEDRKLEIKRVNLADVTEDFLRYLESLEKVTPRVLADFIRVAARLILIKSHTLLPKMEISDEDERDMAELEERLKLYKEFRSAETNILQLWEGNSSFAREYMAEVPSGFYLKDELKPETLAAEIARLSEELLSLIPETEEESIKLISLEETIIGLMAKVDTVLKTSFNEIARGKERGEIITLFLALLHLLKDSMVSITQDSLFSDIAIAHGNINEDEHD